MPTGPDFLDNLLAIRQILANGSPQQLAANVDFSSGFTFTTTTDANGVSTLHVTPSISVSSVASVRQYGAQLDGVTVTDAAMSSGSGVLTCATSQPFKASDVGKLVKVLGAGAAGVALITTIASFTSASQVTLTATASTNVSSKVCDFGTDDAAAFNACITALSSLVSNPGTAMFIPGGTAVFASQVLLKSNLTVIATPYTRLIGNIGSGGNQFATILAQPGATTATTTTAAQANVGSMTISTTASIPAGSTIEVDITTNLTFIYKTTAVSGAGPYTVTLDRPVARTIGAGANVFTLAGIVENVRIFGNGMSMSGYVARHIEMLMARDCYIEGVKFDCVNGTFTDTAFSWDTGSYRSIYRKMFVDGVGATTGNGSTGESCEACAWFDCTWTNVTAANGLHHLQTTDCVADNLSATNCNVGLMLTSSVTPNTTGFKATNCRFNGNVVGLNLFKVDNSRVVNVQCDNNTTYGIEHQSAGTGCVVAGSAHGNTSGGLFTVASSAVLEIGDLNCDSQGAGVIANSPIKANKISARSCTWGVQLQAGADGSIIGEVDVSECTSGGFVSSVDCEIGRFYSVSTTNNSGYLGILSGTPDVIVRSGYISMNPPGTTSIGCVYAAAGRIFLSGMKILVRTNAFGIKADTGSTITITDTVVSKIGSATGTQGAVANAGATLKIGANVDLTNTATPITATGTVTMAQNEGDFVGTQTTAGTRTLSQVEAQAKAIRSTSTITGNVRYDVPANIPGLEYTVENLTSGAFTFTVGVSGGTGIVVASGKRARVRSDGTNMQRVTADT